LYVYSIVEEMETRSDPGAASNSDEEDSSDSEEELDEPKNENEEEENRYICEGLKKI
jgi:hypothetical protein